MATQAKRDYYEILSVARTATEQEIKTSFQTLSAQFHANGQPKNIEDVEEVRRLVTAYRVLSDASKRQEYDRHGCVVDPISTWSDAIPMHTSHSGFWLAVGEELGGDLFDFIN